jgi:hypothetical protein
MAWRPGLLKNQRRKGKGTRQKAQVSNELAVINSP